jgi:hypothetical protein
MHSHERRLPGNIIDDEFEVCFEHLLSVMLAKRRLLRVPVRVTCQFHTPGAPKKKQLAALNTAQVLLFLVREFTIPDMFTRQNTVVIAFIYFSGKNYTDDEKQQGETYCVYSPLANERGCIEVVPS